MGTKAFMLYAMATPAIAMSAAATAHPSLTNTNGTATMPPPRMPFTRLNTAPVFAESPAGARA